MSTPFLAFDFRVVGTGGGLVSLSYKLAAVFYRRECVVEATSCNRDLCVSGGTLSSSRLYIFTYFMCLVQWQFSRGAAACLASYVAMSVLLGKDNDIHFRTALYKCARETGVWGRGVTAAAADPDVVCEHRTCHHLLVSFVELSAPSTKFT